MVAIIAGGNGVVNIEAYSPGGGCSLSLGTTVPLTGGHLDPIMGYINGKITFCQTNLWAEPNRSLKRFFFFGISTFLL